MKPNQLFNRLFFTGMPASDRPERDFLLQMGWGKSFQLHFGHSKPGKTDQEDERLFLSPNSFDAKVSNIAKVKQASLTVTLTIVENENMPPGIKPGTYTLDFDDGVMCAEFPADMFDDEEVDEGYMREWKEATDE